MDIGNQQRVIIVEPEPIQTVQEEPVPVDATREQFEFVGEWPLPLDIEPAH